jgi:predicted phage terminase large subunit-like protein
VHVVFGVDHLNNLYLLDVWRGRPLPTSWVEAFCDLVEKYRRWSGPRSWARSKSGIGSVPRQAHAQRRLHVNSHGVPDARRQGGARPLDPGPHGARRHLFYPKNAPWAADWLAELLNFPASKHDDQVDAMGLGGQLLDIMVTRPRARTDPMKLPKLTATAQTPEGVDPMTL